MPPATEAALKVPEKATGWARFLQQSGFLRHYLWKYRKLVLIGLAALALVDGLEILPPLLIKRAVDSAVAGAAFAELVRIAAVYLGISLIQGFCRYAWRMYLIRASMLSGRDMRNRLVGHLFGLSAHFFDRRRIGDLMSHATSDIDAVRMALGPGLLTLADALLYLFTVPVAMFLLSPRLTVLAFIPLVFVPWFVMRNEREVHSRFEKVQDSFSRISAAAQENLGGIRVVKAFAREDAQVERFRCLGEDHIALSLSLARVQSAFGPTLDFTMSLGLVALLYVGGQGVIETTVTLGTFVAFQRYIEKMVWPMTALGLAITHYQRAVASTGRIRGILDEATNVPESPQPRLPAGWKSSAPDAPWKTEGRVEFRSLSFRFPGASVDSLRSLSLMVEPGERVAFVGAIGAGKTALLGLLPRLYPVGRGMLFVDGIDVNEWPLEELRSQVGYVGQEVFLFSDTVVENVGYGIRGLDLRPEQPPARIEEAAQLAAVHEEVLGFSEGWRTRLGERGVNLSGGQKQRLTIARAIAKQPSILVLDDALSSVDVQTEEKILKGLRARSGRNTELIAAHRISTIRDANRIVLIENGSFRQIGTHEQLLRDRSGPYRLFHEQQRLKEDLEQYVESVEAAPETLA